MIAKKKMWRMLGWVVLLLVCMGGILAYYGYTIVFNDNVKLEESYHLYLYEGSSYDEVVHLLEDAEVLKSAATFHTIAQQMNLPNNIHSGHYVIEPGMSNKELISMLRGGLQTPVTLTFNSVRTKEDLAGRIAEQLMIDSAEVLDAMLAPELLEQHELTKETAMTLFLPNTYEVYWNSSPEKLMEKISAAYDNFWNENRRAKAEALDLTPTQVSILASIVQSEQLKYPEEWKRIAGLYLNRLDANMKLQADPTVKFAVGKPELTRVLFVHTEVEHPYNTYHITGLPPGPIYLPDIAAIEAVLNHEEHEYYYMCAKADLSGLHAFARTHAEHDKNAASYHAAISE